MLQLLVIDDDPVIRLVLKKALEGQGYAVITASTGEAGLAQAHENQPALIICDWQMPGMDGLEVCRQVKSAPDLATTFFILLTSKTEVHDRIEGLDAGANEFLGKPIEMSELKARVRAGLRMHLAAKDLQSLAQDLQIQKQTLEAELTEAAGYVRSLLPPAVTDRVSIASRFLPSKQLGGDCFDYYWLDPDYLMIYLLDVSGHGLGSALPSVSVQNLLRSQALPGANFYQPSHVLKALNEMFQMGEHNDRYFTIWYGVYNQQKRQLTYASAGHPPAVLMSGDPDSRQVTRLKTRGAPIGMLPNTKYVSASCHIEPASSLYIFSDGIYEIKQPNGERWVVDDFVECLKSLDNLEMNTSGSSGVEHLDRVLNHVRSVSDSHIFEDDCSLLHVQFN